MHCLEYSIDLIYTLYFDADVRLTLDCHLSTYPTYPTYPTYTYRDEKLDIQSETWWPLGFLKVIHMYQVDAALAQSLPYLQPTETRRLILQADSGTPTAL